MNVFMGMDRARLGPTAGVTRSPMMATLKPLWLRKCAPQQFKNR
jgi:hypothetical protein